MPSEEHSIIGTTEFNPKLCPFCGFPNYQTDDIAGSVVTLCCKQKLSTCCPGAADGQSG